MERLGIHHVNRTNTPSDPIPDPEPPLHPAEEARRRSAADRGDQDQQDGH